MTDATSRARKCIEIALWNLHYDGKILTQDERIHAQQSCIADASDIVGDLEGDDFAIIDTRTHAAIPREPSDEVVERVFCVLAWGSPKRPPELADDEQIARAMAGNPPLVRKARAAIAALVAAQTQGGEREQ